MKIDNILDFFSKEQLFIILVVIFVYDLIGIIVEFIFESFLYLIKKNSK